MSAADGLQPDVLWGQDSGTSSDCVLLAAALVPGDPGPGTGGDFMHHHHLHPEVVRADNQIGACCFLWLMLKHVGHTRMDFLHLESAVDLCFKGLRLWGNLLCSDGISAGF